MYQNSVGPMGWKTCKHHHSNHQPINQAINQPTDQQTNRTINQSTAENFVVINSVNRKHPSVCDIYTEFCWGGKHVNITMKPTNSPTQGQPNPRKIRFKSGILGHFFPQQIFFVGWDWFYMGNSLRETQSNQIFRKHPVVVLRRTIVIRTHEIHKNLYITLFWLTKFGPEYYVPP